MPHTCVPETPEVATRVLTAVSCPLGFVHGFHCSDCNWAVLFPECHVRWAVPFCYELQVRKDFAQHVCQQAPTDAPQMNGCKLCENEKIG